MNNSEPRPNKEYGVGVQIDSSQRAVETLVDNRETCPVHGDVRAIKAGNGSAGRVTIVARCPKCGRQLNEPTVAEAARPVHMEGLR